MTLPAEQRRANQLQRLNELLAHARRHVPLCAERYADYPADFALGSIEEIAQLPFTSKDDLNSGFPDGVTAQNSDRNDWQYVASSGTVSRVVTVMDFARRDAGRAALNHVWFSSCGYRLGQPIVQLPPNICNIVCGADASNEQESFRRELFRYVSARAKGKSADLSELRGAFERRILYRTRTFDPLAPNSTSVDPERLEFYFNRIRNEHPVILHALPEYMQILAAWILETKRAPMGVPNIYPMGGLLSPAARQPIEEAFGGTFRNIYGTAELGPIAFEEQPGEGMKVIEEQFVVEILRDGRPAAMGEAGHVHITDLCNFAMPFIRYRVGDIGRWLEGDDGFPRLEILGRDEECLHAADGSWLTGSELRDFMLGGLGCRAFRVSVKGEDRIVVDFVEGTGGPTAREVERKVGERLGGGIRVRARDVRSIAAEKSGKFKVVRRMPR